ncbi:MAG: carboxypeptidase-like regulatory domain-containing protein [Flavitalea sp.]
MKSSFFLRVCFVSTALIAGLCGSLNAQDLRTVQGLVIDGEVASPLEAVRVTVKGTENISGSQSDGAFYISVNKADSVLVFTHKDYEPVEIRLTKSNDYKIVLRPKKVVKEFTPYVKP